MKKRITLIVLLLLCTLLAGCKCEHDWQEADCTQARICILCGETEGDPLGHMWKEATCTKPKTCRQCALTEGEALSHVPGEETITKDLLTLTVHRKQQCAACGEILKEEAAALDVLVEEKRFLFSPEAFLKRLEALAKSEIPDFAYEMSVEDGTYSAWVYRNQEAYKIQFFNDKNEMMLPQDKDATSAIWCVTLTTMQKSAEPVLVMDETLLRLFCKACDPKFDDGDLFDLTLASLTAAMNSVENGELAGYHQINGLYYELVYLFFQEPTSGDDYAIQNVSIYPANQK